MMQQEQLRYWEENLRRGDLKGEPRDICSLPGSHRRELPTVRERGVQVHMDPRFTDLHAEVLSKLTTADDVNAA